MEAAAYAHIQDAHITEYSGGKLTSNDVRAIKLAVAGHFKAEESAAEETVAEEEVTEEPLAAEEVVEE